MAVDGVRSRVPAVVQGLRRQGRWWAGMKTTGGPHRESWAIGTSASASCVTMSRDDVRFCRAASQRQAVGQVGVAVLSARCVRRQRRGQVASLSRAMRSGTRAAARLRWTFCAPGADVELGEMARQTGDILPSGPVDQQGDGGWPQVRRDGTVVSKAVRKTAVTRHGYYVSSMKTADVGVTDAARIVGLGPFAYSVACALACAECNRK
jgi:hypothetical protein